MISRLTTSICLILSMTGLNCKKTPDYEFVVLGRVAPGMWGYNNNTFVVTDLEGNILEISKISTDEPEFTRKFRVDGDIKLVNVHLGIYYGDYPTYIYTHLEVPNGGSIAFDPFKYGTNNNSSEQKTVRINGLFTLDSLGFLANTLYTVKEPLEPTAHTSTHVSPNESAVVHCKANGNADFRYLYISDSTFQHNSSVIDVEWDQFKPVPPPTKVAIDQALSTIEELNVSALTSDFKYFSTLGPGTHVDPLEVNFIFPEEAPKVLRIQLRGEDFLAERIFQPGESLKFDKPDLEIGNISSTPGVGFKIASSGDIDLLEVNCDESSYYRWKILGKPSAFQNVKMPTIAELQKHIAFKNENPTPFWRFKVKAYQFGKHTYEEVKEGFPYRTATLFPAAQSGFFMLEKSFE